MGPMPEHKMEIDFETKVETLGPFKRIDSDRVVEGNTAMAIRGIGSLCFCCMGYLRQTST